tara:strand:+ start:3157 stop:4452 length:1296 start_codon:yes stop_codon:yes gene_type:complete
MIEKKLTYIQLKIYIYSTILFSIFLKFILNLRLKRGKEDKKSVLQKLSLDFPNRPSGNIIWIHAVSVGESYSAITVAEILMKYYKNASVLITTSTITSKDVISSSDNSRIIHQYLPFDRQAYVNKFLNYWRPSKSIFMEAEIWPNYFQTIKKNNIPLYLLNARMSKNSFRKWLYAKSLISTVLNIPRIIGCQDQISYNRLQELGAKNLKNITNIKYANMPLLVDNKIYRNLRSTYKNKVFCIAASTHQDENKIIIEVHQKLAKEYPDFVTILAPRHPNTINEIKNYLNEKNISWSPAISETYNENINFLLVDKIGVLGTYYSISDIAIIGGSIQDIGGHNPIEAAQHKCIIIHGNNVANFKEIYDLFDKENLAINVINKDVLFMKISDILRDHKYFNKFYKNISNLIENKKIDVENEIREIIVNDTKDKLL